MRCNELIFSDHAIMQMFRRSISVEQVKAVLENGSIIKSYSNDKPFPSYLVLGYVGKRPLHVLAAKDKKQNLCTVITAYEPDSSIWQTDFKIKKK